MKQGAEVGWLGFPSMEPNKLSFFSGHISCRLEENDYLVDGVAINGVSGGPAFYLDPSLKKPRVCGVITAYHPNYATGTPLPGVSLVRSVDPYLPTIETFRSLDQAKEEAEKETNESGQNIKEGKPKRTTKKSAVIKNQRPKHRSRRKRNDLFIRSGNIGSRRVPLFRINNIFYSLTKHFYFDTMHSGKSLFKQVKEVNMSDEIINIEGISRERTLVSLELWFRYLGSKPRNFTLVNFYLSTTSGRRIGTAAFRIIGIKATTEEGSVVIFSLENPGGQFGLERFLEARYNLETNSGELIEL